MKKKTLSLYCIILMLFCQILLCCASASALSEKQKMAISENCTTIKQSLESIQKIDSRTRIYLGSYYEKILSKYMIPLNSRLVENSIPNADLIKNQSDFKEAKDFFTKDFVEYQKILGDELLQIDCKNNPVDFYTKLAKTRNARASVQEDLETMQKLISKHQKIVKELMETL